MRKSLIFIIFALVFLTPFILQADIYTTMQEIVNTMEGYVIFLEDSLNQEIVHFQADIIGEDGKSFSRTFHEGWTYGITAFADWRVTDLDITIYKDVDGQWVELESDDAVDNHPTVTIVPSSTGIYLIELGVYSFAEDYTVAHYGMLIYHELH